MATKKKPARRATARKPAPRARQSSRKKVAAKKTTPAARAKPAAAKKAAPAKAKRTRSNVEVISRVPAARRGAGIALDRIPSRAVFIDVENTSSEDDLFEVIEALNIDRAVQPTEVTAVGNWRAIGQRLARRLAGMGAQLVHTAPNATVKDWSDLWIAVAAGCWLGTALPGDVLEIVSNDRAFDAVGDAAAARGVVYRRLLHKRGAHAAATAAAAAEEEEPKRRRRSRGGRRRRGRGNGASSAPATSHAATPHAAATHHPAPAPHAPAAHHAPAKPHGGRHQEVEPHGATRDQMVSVISRLGGGDPSRWINLDVLEKELKAEGFARPPGSPRLVTRLRTLKDVEIDSHGRVRFVAAPPAEPEPPAVEEEAAAAAAAPKKRRRRRKPSAESASREGGEALDAGAAPFAAAPMLDPPAE